MYTEWLYLVEDYERLRTVAGFAEHLAANLAQPTQPLLSDDRYQAVLAEHPRRLLDALRRAQLRAEFPDRRDLGELAGALLGFYLSRRLARGPFDGWAQAAIGTVVEIGDVGMRRDLEQAYRDLRSYAFAIAYRMLGSVSEAEDIVQETFLRLAQDNDAQIRSPKAYIATIATRLAIDQLRSARARRETYFGPWLPEPVLDDPVPGLGSGVAGPVELADSLSMAFLVVLESLNPLERAVFLLHDVFSFEYHEIAAMVDKSEANCRQLASRARRRAHAEQPRFTATREQRDRLAERFFAACQRGDMQGLVELLANDAVLYGDGGPRGAGINRPIYGRDGVATMLETWFRRLKQLGIEAVPVSVNGQPGAKFLDPEGRLVNVITIDVAEDTVQTVRSVINPDKLTHLGELSPLGRRKHAPDGPVESPGGGDG